MTRRDAIKTGGMASLVLALPIPFPQFKHFNEMDTTSNFEIIIIGGSYSGLSAAMTLGRSMRKVLIIDSGLPCNRQTPHSHNFITQDGKTPGEIASTARSQALAYPTVSLLEDLAVEGRQVDQHFEITTEAGKRFTSEKLVFATGIKDLLPNIPGFSECWGISVVHCPYCHGYEIRGKKTAIMANGERALHLAPMVRNLTEHLSIITSGQAEFDAEQRARIEKNGIRIIEKEIVEIEHKDGYLEHIQFDDETKESFEACYGVVPFQQHSDIPVALGCELNDQGFIQVDMMCKTTIDGVFACGDNSSRLRSVANAVASGNIVGAIINMELSNEQF